MTNRQTLLRLPLPCLLLLLLAIGALLCGSVHIAPQQVWWALTDRNSADPTASLIVLQSRLPGLLCAASSGAALAVAGLLMQTLFRNPLADPSLLGVGGGASLGAATALLAAGGTLSWGGGAIGTPWCVGLGALIGAAAIMVLLCLCASVMRQAATLLIVGLMLSFLTAALVSLLAYFAQAEGLRRFVVWGMGDFSALTLGGAPAYLLLTLLPLCVLQPLANSLDALLLGDDYACTLGLNLRQTRTLVLILSCWLTAIVTAMCGPVAFLGLAVPHIARRAAGSARHQVAVPGAAVWGATLAVACHIVCHLPTDGTVLPLAAITPLIGVPVVFLVLRHS